MNDSDLLWQEKSCREILETPVFNVTERECLSAKGVSGKYIVLDARDWATVIAVIDRDFLMVKQWRHGHKGLSIEFPGGVVDKNESPIDGARRELLEETGFSAGKLTCLGSVNPNPALFSNRFHVFLAEELSKTGAQKLDDDEVLNYIRIPQEEVFKKMGTEEYPHALMCAALELYRRHISG